MGAKLPEPIAGLHLVASGTVVSARGVGDRYQGINRTLSVPVCNKPTIPPPGILAPLSPAAQLEAARSLQRAVADKLWRRGHRHRHS
jgi:hypothetical protein